MTTPSKHGKRATIQDELASQPLEEAPATARRAGSVARETRPLAAITTEQPQIEPVTAAPDAEREAAVDQPSATADAGARAAHAAAEVIELPGAPAPMPAGADDTLARAAMRPPTPSQPRKTTLASAIARASSSTAPAMRRAPSADAADLPLELPDAFEDEIADEVDEWSAADQPTVVLSPAAFRRRRPNYLDTGEHQTWPPRDMPGTPRPGTLGSATTRPPVPASVTRRALPRTPARPVALDGPRLAAPDGPRLAAPDGRRVAVPGGGGRAALSNPRMHRFQELRRQRMLHAQGTRAPDEALPVTELVRQWWADLLPGLERALHYQREARASGMHPIPAHEPSAGARLGDAFGQLAASARELTERAQSAAVPRLKRLHDQAEQAAQAFIEKFEGNQVRQQGPFLGPGRVAVFFRPAVTVGQAQRLLAATQARPLRIIPRKHGLLALVRPGTEAEVSHRLRQHPYVRDVVYLEYDDYGDPVEPQALP